jgi:hypothetical protein
MQNIVSLQQNNSARVLSKSVLLQNTLSEQLGRLLRLLNKGFSAANQPISGPEQRFFDAKQQSSVAE